MSSARSKSPSWRDNKTDLCQRVAATDLVVDRGCDFKLALSIG